MSDEAAWEAIETKELGNILARIEALEARLQEAGLPIFGPGNRDRIDALEAQVRELQGHTHNARLVPLNEMKSGGEPLKAPKTFLEKMDD